MNPDSNQIASNTITGNLRCESNIPAMHWPGGTPNLVLGPRTGECVGL